MTMITPSYLGETIEYSSLHACRSTLEDPTAKTPGDKVTGGSINGSGLLRIETIAVGEQSVLARSLRSSRTLKRKKHRCSA